MSLFLMPVQINTSFFDLLESLRATFFWTAVKKMEKISIGSNGTSLSLIKLMVGWEIGSRDSFNLALLYKWRWRFFSEEKALWVKVIKNLCGFNGGLHVKSNRNRGPEVWNIIISVVWKLHEKRHHPAFYSQKESRKW